MVKNGLKIGLNQFKMDSKLVQNLLKIGLKFVQNGLKIGSKSVKINSKFAQNHILQYTPPRTVVLGPKIQRYRQSLFSLYWEHAVYPYVPY